jgi:tRNA(Ile2) C34 agmatinyltransferase TiaS
MEDIIKILEEIKEHQMQTVQLARTTTVYKLADKALNIALHIHGVMESDCDHHLKYMGKDLDGFRICKKCGTRL